MVEDIEHGPVPHSGNRFPPDPHVTVGPNRQSERGRNQIGSLRCGRCRTHWRWPHRPFHGGLDLLVRRGAPAVHPANDAAQLPVGTPHFDRILGLFTIAMLIGEPPEATQVPTENSTPPSCPTKSPRGCSVPSSVVRKSRATRRDLQRLPASGWPGSHRSNEPSARSELGPQAARSPVLGPMISIPSSRRSLRWGRRGCADLRRPGAASLPADARRSRRIRILPVPRHCPGGSQVPARAVEETQFGSLVLQNRDAPVAEPSGLGDDGEHGRGIGRYTAYRQEGFPLPPSNRPRATGSRRSRRSDPGGSRIS